MLGIEHTNRWKSSRFRSLFTENKRKNDEFAVNHALQFYFGTIIPKKRYELTEDLIETYKKYTVVSPGDIVINGLNLNYDFVSQRIGMVKERGIITSAYITIRTKENINANYYCYLLKAMDSRKFFHGMGTGIRLTLSFENLKNFLLPVPPRDEQEQIVRFLDWKVSAINRLINIRHKQITHMEGLEKEVINNAMCKGLYDGVSMKDSGINWIRDIPKHWNTIRCKFLFRERDERSKTGSEQHLSMSQKFGLIPDNQLDERRMMSESYQGGKLCHTDDLVLNRLKAHLGVFAIAPQLGVVSPDYTVLIPNKDRILPSYAETILKSSRCRGELRRRVRGVVEGFWRLYTNDFYNIVLPIPPCKEQNEIMNYIQKLKNKVQNYKSTTVNEIADLEDLKARLISDVVTGKIDVRGVEVPEVEFVDEAAGEEDFEVDNELFGISE